MGNDDLQTSIAHLVLCCVAGNGLGRNPSRSYTYPGMHANFFIHGVLGFFHHQSRWYNKDYKDLYNLSVIATRYLAMPCLMADLYRHDKNLSTIHLLSGVVPFVLAVCSLRHEHLGNLLLAGNIASLAFYALQNNAVWGFYIAGAAFFAYFVKTQPKFSTIQYPLALAFLEYLCGILDTDLTTPYTISLKATRYLALPCLMADLYRHDNLICAVHLASGVLPFVLAIAGQENVYLGNLLIACNIVSLGYYSMQNSFNWGWYTTASAVLAYFVSPATEVPVLYPLALALLEYCSFRVFTTRFQSAPPPARRQGLLDADLTEVYTISLKATRYLALPCLMADLYRHDQTISMIHLVSGVLPFALALAGQENEHLGSLFVACNIISLGYYSMEHKTEWGWYTTAAAVLAYFVTPISKVNMLYPLALALMEYCAFRVVFG